MKVTALEIDMTGLVSEDINGRGMSGILFATSGILKYSSADEEGRKKIITEIIMAQLKWASCFDRDFVPDIITSSIRVFEISRMLNSEKKELDEIDLLRMYRRIQLELLDASNNDLSSICSSITASLAIMYPGYDIDWLGKSLTKTSR